MRCKFKGCYKLAVGSTTWCRSHSPAPTAHNITGTTSSSGTSGTSSSGNGATASTAVNKTSTTTSNTVGGTTNTDTTTAAAGLGLRNYLNDLVFQSEKMTQKGKDSSDDSDSDMDEAQVLYGRSHMK